MAVIKFLVALSSRFDQWNHLLIRIALRAIIPALFAFTANAAVIPEDRTDALFHAYSGGGITVSGPSLLVRKGFKDKVSISANFYQDMISSASIDVLVSGSKYTEERTEVSVGIDYLQDSTLLSLGLGNSSEDDYEANSVSFGISQDFFGDMTTLSIGYAHGEDTIMRNGAISADEEKFEKYAKRRRYSLGLTQVLTKKWIMALSLESVVDAGYLNNPYRSFHYLSDTKDARLKLTEIYPETHNSDAFAIRSMYYLPYRASLRAEARIYDDSWGVRARNFELRYTHPIRESLTLEVKARTYSQSKAYFYEDLFNYSGEYDVFARDKELSTYTNNSFGIGITYDLEHTLPFIEKQSVSLFWDFMAFDYDNFLDACASQKCVGRDDPTYAAGDEPSYSFQANVLRVFFSVYY